MGSAVRFGTNEHQGPSNRPRQWKGNMMFWKKKPKYADIYVSGKAKKPRYTIEISTK